MSPLFKTIRQRQPHNQNHLRPRMIWGLSKIMREIIALTNPHFTHPGAEEIYTKRAGALDAYARRFAEFIDPIWDKEYQDGKVIEPERMVSQG